MKKTGREKGKQDPGNEHKSIANEADDNDDWGTAALILGIGIALSLFVQWYFNNIKMLSRIPSSSMENTLMIGDILICDRKFDKISRYDIVVFSPPKDPGLDEDELYIKRVIGLPGEEIRVEDGEVYADGVKLDSSFIREKMRPFFDGTFEVPEGCCFVLGDNRNNSYDSRLWESHYLPEQNIIAVAERIILPFKRAGSLAYETKDDGE